MFRKRAEKKRRADRLGEDTQDAYGNTDFSAKAVEDFLKNLQSKEGRPPSRKEGRPSSRQGESLSTANHDEAPRDAVADAAALDNENDEASYNLYEVYRPAKFKEGKDHPDQIVETGSLANVSPPDIIREHSLKEPILKGCLSSAQLESIQYAMQKFEGPKLPNGETQGFLLGDGAGVGKGRQISGLIQECWSKGIKRILWVSVSSDLRWDAKRDLADVGVDLGDVELWPRLKEGKATTLPSGDLEETHGIRKGVVFCTYMLLVNHSHQMTRLEQLVSWLQSDGKTNCLIVLDECHKAKNLLKSGSKKGSQTAHAVVKLQAALPRAYVLYCSATGASEPDNLAYMTRLGTWGFSDFKPFLSTLRNAGMGAMEMFAMSLKATGAYCCRTLSYKGADFDIKVVEIDKLHQRQYNKAARFWLLLYKVWQTAGKAGAQVKRSGWAQFWGAHLRFFRQMLMAVKVPALTQMVLDAVHKEKLCVIIGLQSTGEAAMSKKKEDEDMNSSVDLISAPKMIIRAIIEKGFPCDPSPNPDGSSDQLNLEMLGHLAVKVEESLKGWRSEASRGCNDLEVLDEKTAEQVEEDKLRDAIMRGDLIDLDDVPSARGSFQRGCSRVKGEGGADGKFTDFCRASTLLSQKVGLKSEAGAGVGNYSGFCQASALLGQKVDVKPEAGTRETHAPELRGHEVNSSSITESISSTRESLTDVTRSQTIPASSLHSNSVKGYSRFDAIDLSDEEENAKVIMETSSLSDGSFQQPPRRESFGLQSNAGVKRVKLLTPEPVMEERRPAPASARTRSPFQAPLLPRANLTPDTSTEPGTSAIGGHDFNVSHLADPQVMMARAARNGNQQFDDFAGFDDDQFDDLEDDDAGALPPGTARITNDILLKIQKMLLEATDCLDLPANPLDQLKENLGGEAAVAEMTGRTEHLVLDQNGRRRILRRREDTTPQMVNMIEKEALLNGEKNIAIISEAASCGISLHADRRCKNQRRRLHITLELPWSADKAIQQFGRSHRSNQTSAPIYRLLVTSCGGERRFASSAAKRLQSLGALMKGDRRALGAGCELREFDFDNQHGTNAIKSMMNDIMIGDPESAKVAPPRMKDDKDFYDHVQTLLKQVGFMDDFFGRLSVRAHMLRVDRFLNRLLGLALSDQKLLFDYFSAFFDWAVTQAKSEGTYDRGIVSLKASSIKICPSYPEEVYTDGNGVKAELVKLDLDRGMSWEEALYQLDKQSQMCQSRHNGFFQMRADTDTFVEGIKTHRIALFTKVQDKNLYLQRTPNEGLMKRVPENFTFDWKPISQKEAEGKWRKWYAHTRTKCLHKDCQRSKKGETCFYGLRHENVFFLTGAVLSIWKDVHDLTKNGRIKNKVVHVDLDDETRVVGLQVQREYVGLIKRVLDARKKREEATRLSVNSGKAASEGPTLGPQSAS